MDDTLVLLGVPRRVGAGEPVFLTPGMATQLAAILALRGDWVARDELVTLLWPDADTRRGRHNLSQLLHMVKRSAWGHDLEASPARVRWPIASDVEAFRAAIANGDWQRAAEYDAGSLLEGTPEGMSEPLDAWLRAERADLHASWHEALVGYATALSADERWSDAARVLRRALTSDDLLEGAVQGLIRAEAQAGRRDAALQAFEAFRARLADELSLEPLEATSALATAVRRGDLDPETVDASARPPGDPTIAPAPRTAGHDDSDAADAAEPQVRPGPVANLEPDPTPFVGRSLELAELHALARRGTHRLVTITGAGGSGKSRLARQLARERSGHFEDGATWVPLATATDGATAPAIARALGLRNGGRADALSQALATREQLLVLDEVEHLDDAPALVADLLEGCPGLELLVTSRTALDVPGEAPFPLAGLSVPPDDAAAHGEAYDAVALLVRAAQRVRGDFHPSGSERVAITALTRVLAGHPLAIELAAGWMRSLEPSEVLAEVRRDLGVLRAGDADEAGGPARHTSVRAVFESSWTLLGPSEREALRRLAVFRGGATRETAAAVADVPINALLTLTNRSMLHRERGARFVAPTVIQRFAASKLAEDPALEATLTQRHEDWFVGFARAQDAALDTTEQPAALERLEVEHANLIRALETSVTAGRAVNARAMAIALGRFWRWSGRVREGLAWFARCAALADTASASPERVRSDLARGLLHAEAGEYEAASTAFDRALEDALRLDEPRLMAAARCNQAIVAWRRGSLALARSLFEDAVATHRVHGTDARLAGTLGNLGTVARDSGDLAAAHAHYDEALALAEQLGHVWEVANVRNNKAIAFAYGGDLEAARGELERTLAAQRSIGNRPGIARSLTNLGNVHLDTGDEVRARELYREALDLQRTLGDREGEAHLEVNLGIVAQRSDAFDEAAERYGRALRIRHALGARALVPQSVSCFLDLAVAQGDFGRALVLAGAVRSLGEAVGVPLTPPQQATYDAALATARSSVAGAEAADLERRGANLGEREALAFALGERAAA